MRQATIYKHIKDPKDHAKIIGKKTLRVVNVHDTFLGIGERGTINKAEFKKLAEDLEPFSDGVSVV